MKVFGYTEIEYEFVDDRVSRNLGGASELTLTEVRRADQPGPLVSPVSREDVREIHRNAGGAEPARAVFREVVVRQQLNRTARAAQVVRKRRGIASHDAPEGPVTTPAVERLWVMTMTSFALPENPDKTLPMNAANATPLSASGSQIRPAAGTASREPMTPGTKTIGVQPKLNVSRAGPAGNNCTGAPPLMGLTRF
jgi:hypothetical protein